MPAKDSFSPGRQRGRELASGGRGGGKVSASCTWIPVFVCFVLSGCFADAITVKGNGIWE